MIMERFRPEGVISLLIVVVMFMGLFALSACVKESSGPVDGKNSIIGTTDKLYVDIKTVVTDPEVRPLFSDEDMEYMAELERTYLDATATLRARPDDAEAIQVIAGVATDILMVIKGVEFTEKYRPYVSAIRISIKILRNHIS